MMYDNCSPIAEACNDAVDALAHALLDSVNQYRDVEDVASAIEAMFALADIAENILSNGHSCSEDANKSVIPTILPSRPSQTADGYDAYFQMLARAANRSPRFKGALQEYSVWLNTPRGRHRNKGSNNFVEQILDIADELGDYTLM